MRVSESKRILNMLGSSHIGSLWPNTSHAFSLELITAIVKWAEQSAVRRDLGATLLQKHVLSSKEGRRYQNDHAGVEKYKISQKSTRS